MSKSAPAKSTPVALAKQDQKMFNKSEKQRDTRSNNIIAAKAVADVVRTSLGPRGMDKMIGDSKGEVLITNDGATILKQMEVVHPCARMLVEISKAQDIEAGDGTTTVVVLAGSILHACATLIDRGIHPSSISESFELATEKAMEAIKEMSQPIALDQRESLIQSAITSLASKVVSQHSDILAPIAVDSVLNIMESPEATNVDLRDIFVAKKLGGTVDDTEMIEGLVFTDNKASNSAGGPSRVEKAKIGLIQFCLSAPKSDMESQVVVNDYNAMDRILREERKYILGLVKKISATGCNVLLVQKSILRDATTDLSLHFLAKKGIMVVKNIERDHVDFICKTIGCTPVAHIDHFTEDKLGSADLVAQDATNKIIRVTGVANQGKTVSILVRGSNNLVIDEAERSLHDALCVVRALVKERFLVPGGAAVEMEVAQKLQDYARSIFGVDSLCVKAFAEALEVVPYTLAENAGLDPIKFVTELRHRHAKGEKNAGLNVRKNEISDMMELNVIQPSLVSSSALTLATECVRMILKIDDIVISR